jgi:hypothetical protein
MAGGVYLLDRYKHASPEARAVLNAAGDARRFGAPAWLSLAFLEQTAHDYLPDVEWRRLPRERRDAWVRDAIEDPDTGLTVGDFGVDGPLREPRAGLDARPDGPGLKYKLAGYLEQHLRHIRAGVQPCDSLWTAFASTLDDLDDDLADLDATSSTIKTLAPFARTRAPWLI